MISLTAAVAFDTVLAIVLFAGAAATTKSKQGVAVTTSSNEGAPATTMSNQDAQAKSTSSLNAHAKGTSNLDAQAKSNQGVKAKTVKLQDSVGNHITVQETCHILGFKWGGDPVFNERLLQISTEVLAGVPSLLSQKSRVDFCDMYFLCTVFFVCF